jgi:ribosomal protein L29
MKYKDIQDRYAEELRKMLKDARVKLGRLQFQLANRALKDVSSIRKAKVEVAQISTALAQKSS